MSKETGKAPRPPKPGKVVDLVALLSQSMAEKQQGRGHKKAPSTHAVAHVRSTHKKRAASSKHAPAHRKSA